VPDDLSDALNKVQAAKPAKRTPTLPAPPRPAGPPNLAASLAPKAHRPAASRPAPVNDEFEYDTAMHLAFVGAGQGGGRIANSFWDIGYRRVAMYNTTEQDFAGLAEEAHKLSLGIGGAGKDMQLALQAIRSREADVWDLFTRAWGSTLDCALVCVGLGGGSGSGSALPLVELARKYMESIGRPRRVGAVVSLPSVDEGQKVARNAVTAFRQLVEAGVSPLIVIDNDRVHELYSPGLSKLLPKSNELVSQLLHLFNQFAATKSPIVTFDQSEFAQLMDAGIVAMGSADIDILAVKSPADVSTQIREGLANNVLAQVDLRTGRKAACLFVASQTVLDTYSKDYFAAGFTQLNRLLASAGGDGDTVVHRGVYPSEHDGLQCYVMISELAPPQAKLEVLEKEAGLGRGTVGGSSVAKHLGVG
jgi:cell division GTPase FtsZ